MTCIGQIDPKIALLQVMRAFVSYTDPLITFYVIYTFAFYRSICYCKYNNLLHRISTRFLIKEAQRGSTEIEAYRNLMEILGIEYPKEKEDN